MGVCFNASAPTPVTPGTQHPAPSRRQPHHQPQTTEPKRAPEPSLRHLSDPAARRPTPSETSPNQQHTHAPKVLDPAPSRGKVIQP